MKLLLDQGLPRAATESLARLGFDAVHVGAIGMAEAPDQAILARARQEGAVVVTLDADFESRGSAVKNWPPWSRGSLLSAKRFNATLDRPQSRA